MVKQFFKFIGISGVGWALDFSIYVFLSQKLGWIIIANMISSSIAVSFVFFYSTKRTFCMNNKGLSLNKKYVFYLIYQIILITLTSYLIKQMSYIIIAFSNTISKDMSKIISKLAITPVTMLSNFIVMKILTEKL